MRSYIRHPSDVPIEVVEEEGSLQSGVPQLQNFSHGGLAFIAKKPQALGSIVKIRIPFVQPPFETTGTIKWCKPNEDSFEVGFEFLDEKDEFKIRMVEQICHIEHYKNEVFAKEGRKLSGHEAAVEWITKFASQFPGETLSEEAFEGDEAQIADMIEKTTKNQMIR